MSILACLPPKSFIMHPTSLVPPSRLSPTKLQFVFAQINGNICLTQVQLTTPGSTSSALSAVDATIFIHEFINIFRFSHKAVIHPSDIRILDSIDEQCTRYEEDNGTVFLSKDVMERLRKLTIGAQQTPKRPGRGSRRCIISRVL